MASERGVLARTEAGTEKTGETWREGTGEGGRGGEVGRRGGEVGRRGGEVGRRGETTWVVVALPFRYQK